MPYKKGEEFRKGDERGKYFASQPEAPLQY
jgi:hypothetical protein